MQLSLDDLNPDNLKPMITRMPTYVQVQLLFDNFNIKIFHYKTKEAMLSVWQPGENTQTETDKSTDYITRGNLCTSG